MSNSGPTTEIGGNIAIASAPARIMNLPGKSSRAIAYAVNDASVTAITVAMRAIRIELTSGRRNGLRTRP